VHLPIPRGKRKTKKEKKKKSEERKVITKKAQLASKPLPQCSALLHAYMKDGRGQQCMTEVSL